MRVFVVVCCQDPFQDYFTILFSSEQYATESREIDYFKKNTVSAVQSNLREQQAAGLAAEFMRQRMDVPLGLQTTLQDLQHLNTSAPELTAFKALDYTQYDKLNWYDSNMHASTGLTLLVLLPLVHSTQLAAQLHFLTLDCVGGDAVCTMLYVSCA